MNEQLDMVERTLLRTIHLAQQEEDNDAAQEAATLLAQYQQYYKTGEST